MKISYFIFISFCFIGLSTASFAQEEARPYEKGPLNWNDFQVNEDSTNDQTYLFSYQFNLKPVKLHKGDTTFVWIQTENLMSPARSWIKKATNDEETLRYLQLYFDILELHRRNLQVDLNKASNGLKLNYLFEKHYEEAQFELEDMRFATQYGEDSTLMDSWEEHIKSSLEETPFTVQPRFTKRKFGYGMYLGLGMSKFTGTLGKHFSPPITMNYGFEGSLNNHMLLMLNLEIGLNKVTNSFEEELRWPKDLNSGVALINLNAGYTLLQTPTHKITPFVGFGIIELSVLNKDEQYKNYRFSSHSITSGILYHYSFKKSVRGYGVGNSKLVNSGEIAEHSIRCRLYAATSAFSQLSGTLINFSIQYSILGHFIR